MRVVAVAAAGFAVLVLSTGARAESFWYKLARCETGLRWHQQGQSYVGGLGIYAPNWQRWAPHVGVHKPAWRSTPTEQIAVAEWGYITENAAWGCFRTVGRP